jgi:hypothetical protein
VGQSSIRSPFMHRIVLAALAALALAGTPAEARAPGRIVSVDGVRITIPSGWRRAGQLSDCSDPHQMIALARTRRELLIGNANRFRGGLILLLEGGGHFFAPRQPFRLPAAPTRFEGCCDQPTGPGYEFTFSERGRDFYAFVYSENRAVASEALAILNAIRVS